MDLFKIFSSLELEVLLFRLQRQVGWMIVQHGDELSSSSFCLMLGISVDFRTGIQFAGEFVLEMCEYESWQQNSGLRNVYFK